MVSLRPAPGAQGRLQVFLCFLFLSVLFSWSKYTCLSYLDLDLQIIFVELIDHRRVMGSIHPSITHVRCWMSSSAEFHTHDYRTFLFPELLQNIIDWLFLLKGAWSLAAYKKPPYEILSRETIFLSVITGPGNVWLTPVGEGGPVIYYVREKTL